MRFDVIIVHYRAEQALAACLESLEIQEPERLRTVFVVDNSEHVLSPDLLQRFPSVSWVIHPQNVGFARGVNTALAQSEAPYICLLNPDAVLEGPLWGPLASWLVENQDVGVVGPRIFDADGTVQGSARSFPTLLTAFCGRSTLLSRLRPDNPWTRRNVLSRDGVNDPIDVDWVSGACLVVTREALSTVGPLDERFFLYWEDCDWCTRFRAAGWRVVHHPGLGPVRHQGGTSSRRARWLALYHFHRSAVLLYWKYDGSPARLGSLIALVGAVIRGSSLGLRLAVGRGRR